MSRTGRLDRSTVRASSNHRAEWVEKRRKIPQATTRAMTIAAAARARPVSTSISSGIAATS